MSDQAARAQFGGVAVGFKNELKTPVIVQGYTIVNNMQKRGQAFIVLPGKLLADNNVPANSIRFYTIVDANQPNIVYLRNVDIRVGVQDLGLAIRGMPPKVVLEPLRP